MKKIKKKMSSETSIDTKLINRLMISLVLLMSGLAIYSVIEFYAQDRPEMEAYTCDNPNCGKVHYRVVVAPPTESN